MSITFDSVDTAEIDLSDTVYRITTDIPDEELIHSIKNVGLISPPTLIRQTDGPYRVVCGFRRIRVCRLIGLKDIDARIIPSPENEAATLILAIADNAQNRSLNIIEQAVAISKLSIHYNDDQRLCKEAEKAGLHVNPGLVKKLRKIVSLHDELQRKIAAGIISLTIGLELAKFTSDAAVGIARIIEKLRLTLSHQKEMVRMVREISRLKDQTVAEIINSSMISEIINDPDIDRNQQIKKLRRTLRQIRYPEIVRFEKKYNDYLRQINLPESVHLIPPPDFEGCNFLMQLNFSSLNEFGAIAGMLNQLHSHPAFSKIVEKEIEDY